MPNSIGIENFQSPNGNQNLCMPSLEQQKSEATRALSQALDLSENAIFQSILKETLANLLQNSPRKITKDIKSNVHKIVNEYEKAFKQKIQHLNKKNKLISKENLTENYPCHSLPEEHEKVSHDGKTETINFAAQNFLEPSYQYNINDSTDPNQNLHKPQFKNNIIPYSVQNRLKNIPKFKLYDAESVLKFLVGLHPIADRYPYDFATILQALADLHTGAAEATLSAAASHPNITFDLLRRSLLKHQITEKQFHILKTKYFLRTQTDNETIRGYINNKILIAKILGEENEKILVDSITEGIHPKFLALLGSKPEINSLKELWDQVTYLEMILANRAMSQEIPIAKNPNMENEIPNFSVYFSGESTSANSPRFNTRYITGTRNYFQNNRNIPWKARFNQKPSYQPQSSTPWHRNPYDKNNNFQHYNPRYPQHLRSNFSHHTNFYNYNNTKNNPYNRNSNGNFNPTPRYNPPIQFFKCPNNNTNYNNYKNTKNRNPQNFYNKNKYKPFKQQVNQNNYGLMGLDHSFTNNDRFLPNFNQTFQNDSAKTYLSKN